MATNKSAGRSPWVFVYIVVGLVVTALIWTVIRPYLVITDGIPTATDPFTPFGVFLVNLLLVALSCAAVGAVPLLWKLGHRLL